jgi:hypothetical protein
LVKISAATPIEAAMASSRIAWMSITSSTAKPTASASSAVKPARKRRRNVKRAATSLGRPRPTSCMMPFIFCAPWLMPIANTRKGTRIEYGSSAKPSVGSRPSCQTTATSEAVTTSSVERTQRVNQNTAAVAMATATAKKSSTACTPAMSSPTIFAKPVMCRFRPSRSYLRRRSSSRRANAP